MSRSLSRLLAALMASVLLLGACGDDDEGAETPTAETSEPADAGDDAADDDAADDTTTTTADDEADDTTTTTEDAGSDPSDMPNPASINDFCDVFAAFVEIEDPFITAEGAQDPDAAAEAMRDAFTLFDALFQRAAQLAPDEVAADMASVAEATSVFVGVLSEYDYDFIAMGAASETDPSIEERMQALDTEQSQAAQDNIETYVMANCGIDLSAP